MKKNSSVRILNSWTKRKIYVENIHKKNLNNFILPLHTKLTNLQQAHSSHFDWHVSIANRLWRAGFFLTFIINSLTFSLSHCSLCHKHNKREEIFTCTNNTANRNPKHLIQLKSTRYDYSRRLLWSISIPLSRVVSHSVSQ